MLDHYGKPMTNDLASQALHALHTLATQAHGPHINATHVCAGYTCVPIGQGPDGLARAIIELAKPYQP